MERSMAEEARAKRRDKEFNLCDAVRHMFRQIGQTYIEDTHSSSAPAPATAQTDANSARSAA